MRIGFLRPLTLAVVLGGLAAPVARAATVEAREARIVEVTVYRDRAEVVRQARVELPAGSSSIEFAGIPFGVEPDSLRVSAEGVPATLGAIEIRDRAEKPQDNAEIVAARDEVRRLEETLERLGAEDRVAAELRAFLGSIRAVSSTVESAKVGEGRADPAAIAGTYDVLQRKLLDLSTADLTRAREQRQAREQLEVARAKLATLRPAADIRSRAAAVEVETKRAGTTTLRLAYVAPGAGWRPAYRASLDAATGTVHLVAEAVVRQGTGEDWSGVRLRLSTASPARGVEPPLLMSLLLRPVTMQGGFAKVEQDEAVSGRVYQNVLSLAPGVPAAPEEAAAQEAEIVRSAYNVAFEVPGTSDVPADSREHRVVLRSESLPGRIVHRVVPALAPAAYLTSVTTVPAAYPLLAGPVRVFAEGAYLGSYGLAEAGPGSEVTIPFGVDNRIEVVRVPQPREESREGASGKQHEIDFAFRTKVINRLDRTATVLLEDRVPVSEDERIVVEVDKGTTPGSRPSERRPGVLLWTFDLAPSETREIVLDYRVRYPRDLFVPDLD